MKIALTLLCILSQSWFFGQQSDLKSDTGSLTNIETLLQQYIQIPSLSGQEKPAGDFLKNVCINNGLHIAEFGNKDGQYNFAASILPLDSKKPNIIFLNHIDVVPESNSDSFEPFSGILKDGVIYGRGAIDNKGGALIQLYGILKYKEEFFKIDSPYNVTLLSVSCEESQCPGGIDYVIENHFESLNAAVVIGEGPSELTSFIEGDFDYPLFGISYISKKPFWLELELEVITSGHGSVTPENYAIKELIKALNHLTKKKNKVVYNDINIQFLKDMSRIHKGAKKMVLKHPRLFKGIAVPKLRSEPELFSLFSNTLTVTNLYSNSSTINKLATIAGAKLDCRLLPETDEKEFLARIKNDLKNDSIKIRVIKSIPQYEPSSTDTIFIHNLSKAISDSYPNASTLNIMMPSVNDLWRFRAKKIPAYGSLPVFLDLEEARSVHGKDEHIQTKALHEGSDVYTRFLKLMNPVE